LTAYCAAKGYQISQVVKEVGSGVNDSRPRFLKLLADTSVTIIVVEHKDRATRFGFRYLETLLAAQGRHMEVVNLAADGREDLLADLVAIVSSFCARLYGQRRAKRKTEVLVRELEAKGDKRGGRTGGSRCSWLSAMSSSASSAPIRASR
jgi:predicted site-specific integrase-resolvase